MRKLEKWDFRFLLVFFFGGVGVAGLFTGQALSSKRASSLLHQLVLCFSLKDHRLKKGLNRILWSLSRKRQFRGLKTQGRENEKKTQIEITKPNQPTENFKEKKKILRREIKAKGELWVCEWTEKV